MFFSTFLYHGVAFIGILKAIFVFVIPSLLREAVPVEVVKIMDVGSILLIVLLTIIWLVLSIAFFYKSLKNYESNNFFGFGW